MRQHKLRLDDLTVESFPTTRDTSSVGTVNAHDAETDLCTADGCDPATTYFWCYTCNDTCPPKYTCEDTCHGKHTCDPPC